MRLSRTIFFIALLSHVFGAPGQNAASGENSPARIGAAKEGMEPREWLKRLQRNQLSSSEISSGLVLALRAQADETMRWDLQWGDFVELARTRGEVADDVWRDYLLRAIGVEIRVASQTKRSEGLPIFISDRAARRGVRSPPPAQASAIQKFDLSGTPLTAGHMPQKRAMSLMSGGGSGMGWIENLEAGGYASLQPGPQTFHYTYEIELKSTGKKGEKASEVTGKRVIEGTIPWRLLAENEERSLPALQPDPALRESIAKSISADHIVRDEKDKTLIQTMIQTDRPPTDMAFDLSLRSGAETWPLGPVAWKRDKMGWWAFDTDLPEGIAQLDIVLTPSIRAAASLQADERDRYRLMDVNSIWDGPEIVISGVKIRRYRITMISTKPLSQKAKIDFAQAQLDASDPVVEQWKRDRDTSQAQSQFEQRVKERPNDAAAKYALGCILMATDALASAMRLFEEAQHMDTATALSRQIQRQKRRICAIWLQSAEAGDSAAMTLLGSAYERGSGVGIDAQEAKRWLRNGANGGNAEAMCRLAVMYEHKTGATVQTKEADEWYRVQAREWYRKAAELGNEEAKKWIMTNDR